MTVLTKGSSATVSFDNGRKLSVSVSGGIGSAVVSVGASSPIHLTFGPSPAVKVFGPYEQSATAVLSNSSGENFVYDLDIESSGGGSGQAFGPYSTIASAESANPAASNPGARYLIGSSAPYAVMTSDGVELLPGMNFQLGDLSAENFLFRTVSSLHPSDAGYSLQFREGDFVTPFTYTDRVMNFGYNWDGNAKRDAAAAAFYEQFESAYQLNNDPSSSMKVTEWHLNAVDTSGVVRRPISNVSAWDGGFSETGISGSTINIADHAGNTRFQGLYTNAETFLASAINSSVTTVTVGHARTIANNQRITIDSETMLVTAGGGTTTLTVTRGVDGTTAASHSLNARVFLPASASVLRSSLQISSDADTPFIITNHAGTATLMTINRTSSSLAAPLTVSGSTQAVLTVLTTNAAGAVDIRLQSANGAKSSKLSNDASGNLVLSNNASGAGIFIDAGINGVSWRNNGFSTVMTLSDSGRLGIGVGVFSTTALLHLKAGTATASTAPIKLTAGTNLTTPENGAFEYDGTNLYFTTGGSRKTVTLV